MKKNQVSLDRKEKAQCVICYVSIQGAICDLLPRYCGGPFQDMENHFSKIDAARVRDRQIKEGKRKGKRVAKKYLTVQGLLPFDKPGRVKQ